MGRRILAFFLGMIFGIVVFIGAIAGVFYFAATSVTPGDVYPDSDKFLGDLANMSLYDIYNEISNLYRSKVGIVGENGLYFTLGEFLEQYHIDQSEAFGTELDRDILDLPIFELFGGNTDNALGQVRVSALFEIANLVTGTTDENGEKSGYFSAETIDKVRDKSVADLLNSEKGVPYVFEDVLFTDLLPSIFPSEKSDSLMWALGQTSIGRLFNGIGGNLLLQFKANGVFEAVGSLRILGLLGDASSILSVIFGDNTFSDLIDDDGNINPDEMLGGIYLGDLLGLERNAITDLDGYELIYNNENTDILAKEVDGEYVYVIKIDDVAYEAKLSCSTEGHDDSLLYHDTSCFSYIWYEASSDGQPAGGLYGAIADVTIADLMSGSSDKIVDKILDVRLNEILDEEQVDGLLANLGDMTIRELLNDGVDNIYFGTLFNNARKPVDDDSAYTVTVITDNGTATVKKKESGELIKLEGDTWYEGKIFCGRAEHTHGAICRPQGASDYVCELEDHHHDAECYGFVWYYNTNFNAEREGAQGYLCNFKLSEISSVDNLVSSMTLKDVMGDSVPSMLDSLKNTSLGNIDTAINNMYLGDFLEYTRKPTTPPEGVEPQPQLTNGKFTYYLVTSGNSVMLSTNGREYYEGKLTCDNEHASHTGDCYEFVWYKCASPGNGHEHSGSCYVNEAEGILGKLAGQKISNLNNLTDIIKTFTLKDVLGDDVPSMLKSIENTPISQLSDAIENMYLGDLIGYTRNAVKVNDTTTARKIYDENGSNVVYYLVENNGLLALSDDGKTFYEGRLVCQDASHSEHNSSCYAYVWYDCANTDASHQHGNDCKEVDGMMGRMARSKVKDLNADTIKNTVSETLLREVIDIENANGLFKELGDTKIGDLSSELNALYVGIAMGYHKNEKQPVDGWQKIAEDDVRNNGNEIYKSGDDYYFFDAKRSAYYEARLMCLDEEHSEDDHEFSCYGFVWYKCNHLTDGEHADGCVVTGLNGKMSNLRIDELGSENGMTRIAQSLTIGDLIDSEMMTLTKDDECKLDIIFDGCSNQNCNLAAFMLAQQSGQTAESYYNSLTHENGQSGVWKQMKLTKFISSLLGAL